MGSLTAGVRATARGDARFGVDVAGNRYFDGSLGLGGGPQLGPLALFAVVGTGVDGYGAAADTFAVPLAAYGDLGGAARFSFDVPLTLDVSAARVFRASQDDPREVRTETRVDLRLTSCGSPDLSIALRFIAYDETHTRTLGVAFGVSPWR